MNVAALETMVKQGTAVNLTAAACLTVLLYDHLITFGQEVSRIWPTRLSIAKALFLTNRYVVEGVLLFNCVSASRPYRSESFCIFYLRWLTVAMTFSTAVVQGILVLRVWALYRRNKVSTDAKAVWHDRIREYALGCALFFYFGGLASLIGLVIKDYVGEDVLINSSLRSLPGCYPSAVPSIIAGFWIGPLIVESVLFLLVVGRAVSWWMDGTPTPKILKLLTRDSTIYFAIVFALLLANYLVFEFGPPSLSSLLVTPSTTAGCVLVSHMLINLRALTDPDTDLNFASDLNHSPTYALRTISPFSGNTGAGGAYSEHAFRTTYYGADRSINRLSSASTTPLRVSRNRSKEETQGTRRWHQSPYGPLASQSTTSPSYRGGAPVVFARQREEGDDDDVEFWREIPPTREELLRASRLTLPCHRDSLGRLPTDQPSPGPSGSNLSVVPHVEVELVEECIEMTTVAPEPRWDGLGSVSPAESRSYLSDASSTRTKPGRLSVHFEDDDVAASKRS